ncbi:MAG: hypothetical protein DMG96_27830 [Acidobacteria bacterium]|nr:MAG: hypothetical protein DMG98_22750 [Acidobacteriota bacterium]PYV71871.1 MAG: hypothetical protein DMG96_27830 [Acidobacteriota bacterium]
MVPSSDPPALSPHGMLLVGGADYPGDTIRHAFLRKKGLMTDLGTLYPTCTSMFTGSVALEA